MFNAQFKKLGEWLNRKQTIWGCIWNQSIVIMQSNHNNLLFGNSLKSLALINFNERTDLGKIHLVVNINLIR